MAWFLTGAMEGVSQEHRKTSEKALSSEYASGFMKAWGWGINMNEGFVVLGRALNTSQRSWTFFHRQ